MTHADTIPSASPAPDEPAPAMNLTALGRAVLVAREGRRLEAYRDGAGVWTIGVGHTSAAGPPRVEPGLTITAAACDALFARDVEAYAAAVRSALVGAPGLPLPEHAFDALVSLCFNIGPAAFLRSSVLRRLRAGDPDGAAAAILMWNRPACLIPRRGAEVDQFRTPYATALPRARRGDARPIADPTGSHPRPDAVGEPSPVPALPVGRRRSPARPRATVPAPPQAVPAQAVPRANALARLWSGLRARLRPSA